MNENENRIKRLLITPQLLMILGSGRFEVIADPLPRDARLVRSYYDSMRDAFTIVVASDTFESIQWGEIIPELKPPAIQALPKDGNYD